MAKIIMFRPKRTAPTRGKPTSPSRTAVESCYACLGRPGVVAVADRWFCDRCDEMIRDGRIIPAAADERSYEGLTKAAERHLVAGFRMFDLAYQGKGGA